MLLLLIIKTCVCVAYRTEQNGETAADFAKSNKIKAMIKVNCSRFLRPSHHF